MPIYEKDIHDRWREVWTAHVNVGGVWKEVEISTKVNGEWKLMHKRYLDESDIIGFKMIYLNTRRMEWIYHPDFPSYTQKSHKLPVEIESYGNDIDMDTNPKGVRFTYERFGYEEGIELYLGHLMAVLSNGEYVDVGASNKDIGPHDLRVDCDIDDNHQSFWVSNRFSKMYIVTSGHISYKAGRIHQFIWNDFFSTKHCRYTTPFMEPFATTENRIDFESTILSPSNSRADDFSPHPMIGICRSLKTDDTMHGAFGVLDHHIDTISVNGVRKPFQTIVLRDKESPEYKQESFPEYT